MLKNDDHNLQELLIYSIFVRNHTEEGTFLSIIPDLDRIRALGVDVLWLMPIHPIGQIARKGKLGSPYSIMDYRAVNPELGTLEDLKQLVSEIHNRGMKCILDIVFNHTSRDAVLSNDHPEFYYHKENGEFGNRVGDWTDIMDLDFSNVDLRKYLLETLCFWAQIVDGFRCDVASFVPLDFWIQAREVIGQEKPDFLWLAESASHSFAACYLEKGIPVTRDEDLFDAFEMEYEYDIHESYEEYLAGKAQIGQYLALTNFQEYAYRKNYNKVRFLENHDLPRAASFIRNAEDMENHLAMMFFLKGAFILYAGQEKSMAARTDLFDRDPIDWDAGADLSAVIAKLRRIKGIIADPDDRYFAKWNNEKDIAILTRQNDQRIKLGVFSLKSQKVDVPVDIPDGTYENLMDNRDVSIRHGILPCDGKPVILVCRKG